MKTNEETLKLSNGGGHRVISKYLYKNFRQTQRVKKFVESECLQMTLLHSEKTKIKEESNIRCTLQEYRTCKI